MRCVQDFLRGDGDAFFDGGRIVGADFRADAVFQRRDDLAARGVVLGIGAEHQHDIERQADGISLNLHVAFLHDVEQAHLDFSRQVGQFVDGEDAMIGARQQSVVHGDSLPSSWPPRAALMGSISPIRSAMVTSGVASFST